MKRFNRQNIISLLLIALPVLGAITIYRYPDALYIAQCSKTGLKSMAIGGSFEADKPCLSLDNQSDVVTPAYLEPNSSYDIVIQTGGDRTNWASLTVFDTNGKVLFSQEKAERPGKQVLFTWNGRTSEGQPIPRGEYRVEVRAEVEKSNRQPITIANTRKFDHHPDWLLGNSGDRQVPGPIQGELI